MIKLQKLDTVETRKAAAFVEALAEVEHRFGLILDAIPGGTRIGPLSSPYAVVRESNADPLSLALEVPIDVQMRGPEQAQIRSTAVTGSEFTPTS